MLRLSPSENSKKGKYPSTQSSQAQIRRTTDQNRKIHLGNSGCIFFLLQKLIIGNTKGFIRGKALSTEDHTHSTSDITSGTFSTSRLPVIPVSKGGTGRSTLTSGYFLRGNGTGAITMSSVDDVKAELGVTSATPPSTTINVGSNVSMANIDWICVHIDSNYQYLMTKYIIGSGIFGQNTAYDGSNAALICMLFGRAIGVWGNESFGKLTVNSVTGFCHIASHEQMTGGFRYFSSNSRRIATNQSGTAQHYWTSSPGSSSGVWGVSSGGDLYDNGGPTGTRGFRPFVALKL